MNQAVCVDRKNKLYSTKPFSKLDGFCSHLHYLCSANTENINRYSMDTIYSERIVAWYLEHKRDLPWRGITDPYRIWVSEIILQQTRVNQGMDYYLRFIGRFPDVRTLAEAEEDEVLKYWQGLGYYSRARNLHKAAKRILADFAGAFPHDYKEILSLNGVGEYTAAAIASFAYGLPHPTVDGNVYRVLSRLFALDMPIDSGEGRKAFAALAQELLPYDRPGLHNQAMMEFGALQCVPQSPDCVHCPLQAQCKAFERGMVASLPVKRQQTKIKNRYFNYFYVLHEGMTFLQKRTGNDVWKGLYEFPLIETDTLLTLDELMADKRFETMFENCGKVEMRAVSPVMKHVLSHRNIFARFVTVQVERGNCFFDSLQTIAESEVDRYAVSRLTEMFLETNR